MSRCVPSWDLEDNNPNHDVFRLDYEVAELKWENGQLAMHELGSRRVPSTSSYTWDRPPAAETLEAIVNQATHKPYCKALVDVELVPCLNSHHGAAMTSDALVPISNIHEGDCSTRVGSCSEVLYRTVETNDWSSYSVGESRTFDTYEMDLDGRKLTSTSTENTNSFSKDDSVSHRRTQPEPSMIKGKKKIKAKSSISNKRKRTPAIHNQSERKRRDKINQRIKMLQKLVPNSSKTDKSSMLDEVIEYVRQLQAHVHMMNRMNMSSMMMPLAMQQQQMQMQMSMMGIGMGMNIPSGFNPSAFMHWNNHAVNRAANTTTLSVDPNMYAFLGCQPQSMNMDAYSRMAALYQQMQNPISKN